MCVRLMIHTQSLLHYCPIAQPRRVSLVRLYPSARVFIIRCRSGVVPSRCALQPAPTAAAEQQRAAQPAPARAPV
jgi:hypothetical protein